jgi:hypothetical protein
VKRKPGASGLKLLYPNMTADKVDVAKVCSLIAFVAEMRFQSYDY